MFYDRNNTNLAQHSKVLGSGGLRNFHATDDGAKGFESELSYLAGFLSFKAIAEAKRREMIGLLNNGKYWTVNEIGGVEKVGVESGVEHWNHEGEPELSPEDLLLGGNHVSGGGAANIDIGLQSSIPAGAFNRIDVLNQAEGGGVEVGGCGGAVFETSEAPDIVTKSAERRWWVGAAGRWMWGRRGVSGAAKDSRVRFQEAPP